MSTAYRLQHTAWIKTIVLSVFLLSAFCYWLFAADAPKEFQEANLLYKQGKFSEAADLYQQLIQQDSIRDSAELRFNLANAKFRSGSLSEAIYNYERALALNPWYADARYNLQAVRAKLEYKIEDRRNLFIRFHDLVLKWIPQGWLMTGALAGLFFVLLSAAIWIRGGQQNSFWSFPRAELLTLTLLFGVLAAAQAYYQHHYKEAIVLPAEAEVRYGPSLDNQSLMKLGGGLKVFVVDAREDWSRVVTWNGETGWMRDSDIGKING